MIFSVLSVSSCSIPEFIDSRQTGAGFEQEVTEETENSPLPVSVLSVSFCLRQGMASRGGFTRQAFNVACLEGLTKILPVRLPVRSRQRTRQEIV